MTVSDLKRARAAARKIRLAFPRSAEGRLMASVIEQALFDSVSTRLHRGDKHKARRWLERAVWCAEIAGIESDYIHRVIKQAGLDLGEQPGNKKPGRDAVFHHRQKIMLRKK